MGKVISLINQKGGVGKTTSSINIGKSLADLNYKVLMIDADPQCDLSTGIGIFDNYYTINELINSNDKPVIEDLKIDENLYLIKGYFDLAEIKLVKNIIKNPLDNIKDHFDFVIIDCAPQRVIKGHLTVNECILYASDYVLMPLDVNYNSVKGTLAFIDSLERIKVNNNNDLKILGVFFTAVNKQEKNYHTYRNFLEEANDQLLLNTFIRRDISVKNSQESGVPLNVLKYTTNAAVDYRSLVAELIDKM